MSRINKSELTKLEIIGAATVKFLENGYSSTSIKQVCTELDMSPGNLTFYFPSKEHLLAELVDMLCKFQWKLMDEEAAEGYSSVMAICLELVSMASACEEDAAVKDFFLSAYTSPMSLEIIRNNDRERAKEVFGGYCSGWTDEHFAEAETLVSGIEYATLMTTKNSAPLEVRITGALDTILSIYNVPENARKAKIEKSLAVDYRQLGKRVLAEFRSYVAETTQQALIDLLNGR